MFNEMTVSKLIDMLSDLDPDAKVEVGYESSAWSYDGDETVGSYEEVIIDFTPFFEIKIKSDGTVLLGVESDLNNQIG